MLIGPGVLLLAVARVASMIPIPGLDGAALYDYFESIRKRGGDEGLLGRH